MHMAAHESDNNQRLARGAARAGDGLVASDRALLQAIAGRRRLSLRFDDLGPHGGEHSQGQQHGLNGPVRISNSGWGVSNRLLHWRPAFDSILRLALSKAKNV